MKERPIEVIPNRTNYINGFEVSVNPVKKAINPGSTAIHEAKHVVAAVHNNTGINKATIIPGEDYNGLTQLTRFDPIAAIAPHATGESGTGWDVHIVESQGHSVAAVSGVARSIVEANSDEVLAVAQALEEHGTVGEGEIKRAIEDKDKENVILFIKTPDGKQQSAPAVASKGIVMVPGEWIDLAA